MRIAVTHILMVSLSLLMTLGTLSAGARDYAEVAQDQLYVGTERRYEHLEYFGFYASDMAHWRFAAALAPVTNLTWIEQSDVESTVERLADAAASDVEAVISLERLIFDDSLHLRADYLYTLADLEQTLFYAGLLDQVAMIYPLDEPYLQAKREGGPGVTAIRRTLAELNAALGEVFPEIPLGVIFNNASILRSGFAVPTSYDWVGFDCYANMYDCNDKPFTWYYGKLLTKMTPGQRLMAVPQTWMSDELYERGRNEPRFLYELRLERVAVGLRQRFQHHYELALSDPRFVAVIPFLFSMEAAPGAQRHEGFGLDQFKQRFGDRGMDILKTVLRSGRQVKTRELTYPNLGRSQTEFSLERPLPVLKGKIINVSPDGLVSAWAMDESLPHKALRMQLVAHRDDRLEWSSGIRRSFVFDQSLKDRHAGGRPALGVHGYRHQLPRATANDVASGQLQLSLRAYYDGGLPSDYRDVATWSWEAN